MATPTSTPPAWADRLLSWLIPPELLEELLGDLHEQFEENFYQVGKQKAILLYGLEALRFVRPYFLRRRMIRPTPLPTPNDRGQSTTRPQRPTTEFAQPPVFSPAMIRNYFKIALRNFWRHKSFSAINVLGLALGLTGSLFIYLWVQDELNVDHYHTNGPQLYRIKQRQFSDGKRSATPGTPWPLSLELPKKLPEVVHAAGFSWQETLTFTVNHQSSKELGNWAGVDWFTMFSVPLLAGTPETALKAPNSLAISRKIAQTYFGSPQAALGKAIQIDHKEAYQVTAVFETIPPNSSEPYDFLLPWADFEKRNGWAGDWSNSGPRAYVQLRADADLTAFNGKIKDFLWGYNKDLDQKKRASFNLELFLQPFEQVYLHSETTNGEISGGRIAYVRLFSVVAVFLLLIACINFMNLATARSQKRAKEVGIRKVVGAERSGLIGQFIGEALLLTVLTGAMPAGTRRGGLQPTLVTVQFVVSIALIIGTLVVHEQLRYMQTKNIGFDKEQVLVLHDTYVLQTKTRAFKAELAKLSAVSRVTVAGNLPAGASNDGTDGFQPDNGASQPQTYRAKTYRIDEDYLPTLGMALAQGRNFSKAFGGDSSAVLINQAAAREYGWKNPIGRTLSSVGNGSPDSKRTYKSSGWSRTSTLPPCTSASALWCCSMAGTTTRWSCGCRPMRYRCC